MEYVEIKGEKTTSHGLGEPGEKVPVVGLGTWKLRGKECFETVKSALEIGYRHIDTAQIHHNQVNIGKALKSLEVDRDDVFLTTKLWKSNLTEEDVYRSWEVSSMQLKTDYIDLLLIHWPEGSVPLEETLRAMKGLRDEGKIRYMGVSNFGLEELKRAQEVSEGNIFCNQVEYHPFISQKEVLEYCQEEDILFTSYCPLARGRVTENETIREIGKKYDKTPAQVTLRWHIQQDNVCTIPKSSNKEHLEENLDVFDFELTDREMRKIFKLSVDKKIV